MRTLLFLKHELIPQIGPVEVVFGNRTRQYNEVASGARGGRDLSFSALDLQLQLAAIASNTCSAVTVARA